MPTFFGIDTHRIIYKAAGFGAGKAVTAYIWDPALVKSAEQVLTEVSDGLYYLDYAFPALGTYFGIFYEGGVATVPGTFRIASGTAADPLLNAVPGTYAAGTAGYRIGVMAGLGAGAIAWTYTVTDADTGAPIDGVAVWVTTDSAGADVIASGTTDDSGEVTFHLDAAATRYIWRSRSGYNFTNPDIEEVA